MSVISSVLGFTQENSSSLNMAKGYALEIVLTITGNVQLFSERETGVWRGPPF